MNLTPPELATLYLEQLRAYQEGVPAQHAEPNALYVWEDLICNDPEQAWPVFEEILTRVSEDETFEQIWYRLRLLLHRHYDRFHERAAALLIRFHRFAFVAGTNALDPAVYREKAFDREALIISYRAMHRTHDPAFEVDRLARSDPQRALSIAIEIIHRGVAKGWEPFDLMGPIADVLEKNGAKVVSQMEEIARSSVAVRRVLWRLKRQTHRRAGMRPEVWDRVEAAAGSTTDYTETDAPVPKPEQYLDADERIIEGWFNHEENFWAFSEMYELCDQNPQLAWSITLELIARAEDEREVGAIAAGPLEDLIRKHPDVIWEDLVAKAHTDERFRSAVHGVWVFPEDGDVFGRFGELMKTIDSEPS